MRPSTVAAAGEGAVRQPVPERGTWFLAPDADQRDLPNRMPALPALVWAPPMNPVDSGSLMVVGELKDPESNKLWLARHALALRDALEKQANHV